MISAVVLATERGSQTSTSSPALTAKPLRVILENALASKIDEVICVTGDLAAARREIEFTSERLLWCVNPAAAQRRSALVICGLWASNPRSDGVMLLASDQPLIGKELIQALIERFEKSSAWIVAPSFTDQLHGPVLFRRNLFPELLRLSGDDMGLRLLKKYAENTSLVEWQDEGPRLNREARKSSAHLKERV